MRPGSRDQMDIIPEGGLFTVVDRDQVFTVRYMGYGLTTAFTCSCPRAARYGATCQHIGSVKAFRRQVAKEKKELRELQQVGRV